MSYDPTPALEGMHVPVPQPIEIEGTQEKLGIFPRLRRWFNSLPFMQDFGYDERYVYALEQDGSLTKTDILVADLADDTQSSIGTATAGRGINPKDALGLAKVDLSVVPPAAELHLASAMMDGAAKYGAFNWRENAVIGRVYVAAARRHLLQYLDGEDYDPVSGVHHLGHAMACCGIILDAAATGNLEDNRPLPGAAGRMIRGWSKDTKFQ